MIERFDTICEHINQLRDWDYVESESRNNMRFDRGSISMWVSYTNEEYGIVAEGAATKFPEVRDFLKYNDIKVF